MELELCMGCMQEQKIEGVCPNCGFDRNKYQLPAHHLPPESILNGKYLVGKALGEGGFGITYIGLDLYLQVPVAIKEFFPRGLAVRDAQTTTNLSYGLGEQAQYFEYGVQAFMKEARRLAKFQNLPGIVSVKDLFQENSTVYIVMEYVDGITLKQYLGQNKNRLEIDRVLKIMDPFLASLSILHREGIIHRDISPDNLMIDRKGECRLIDFGAAREFGVDVNRSMSVMVKHGFAPLEQYSSHGNQGPWTDVYAICATIYRCITGAKPLEAVGRISEDKLKKPSEFGIAIHPKQEAAILKGLSIRTEDRYQTVEELRADLYEALEQENEMESDTEEEIEESIPSSEPETENSSLFLELEKQKIPEEKTEPSRFQANPYQSMEKLNTASDVKPKKKTGKKILLFLAAVLVTGAIRSVPLILENMNKRPDSTELFENTVVEEPQIQREEKVTKEMIAQTLSEELDRSGISYMIDQETGMVTMDSSVMFRYNDYTLSDDGKRYLDNFFPVYLLVLTSEEYFDSIREIVFQGHTDTVGSHEFNEELSKKRADSVREYCLDMITEQYRSMMERMTRSEGCAYDNPVYDENGEIDMDASRRVTIDFVLK